MEMSVKTEKTTLPNCKHFVVRKKRFCKMTVKYGEEFCGEHQKLSDVLEDINDVNDNSKIRIICPLDRKHTCYAHNLKKHLKICNARQITVEPYISKGINAGEKSSEDGDVYKLLSTFSVSDIKNVVLKVNEIYEQFIKGKISEKLSSHPLVEEEMSKPEYGDKTKKHLVQASAILGLLNEYKLIKQKMCYIEFGAGRGQLSYWIAKATEAVEGSTILLIERASPKHKRDNKLAMGTDVVQRIRADISDLVLDKLEAISKTGNLMAVTKHLCGEATDLTLRCLANVEENKEKVSGAVLTFCCHHRCRWTPYTGKHFFEENKLSRKDFDMMCGMTSWATSGSGLSRERKTQLCTEPDVQIIKLNDRDTELGLSRSEKEKIGRRCKNVLNWGRLVYLEKLGFTCILHYYVDRSITLENVCIVAYK